MESKIREATKIKYEPVAIYFSDQRPEGARQFKQGKFGCVMFMLGAAARGQTAVFDRKIFGCPGGGVGLGFGNQYQNFPGGMECFCYFLSVGNDQWETGRQLTEKMKPFLKGEMLHHFAHGERYVKSPDLVKNFIECLPITEIPAEYVVFKPLKHVDEETEKPEVVVFLCDMDQLSALVILANYGRENNENVIIPYAAGCQTIGIYPFREAESDKGRAVVGLTDLSAREAIKRQLKDDLMTFAMPFKLYQEMESNVDGSFLGQPVWQNLLKMKEKS
jgi:uncharacterized protein (DUF169 family)